MSARPFCVWCERSRAEGHADDCPRQEPHPGFIEKPTPATESAASKPLWAKCPACDACWPVAYLPLDLMATARAAAQAICPNSCSAKPILANQNDGVLLEPMRAFPLSTWTEGMGDVCWWRWMGHEWLGEAAWIGRPADNGWPGYHTHWTPHPNFPEAPKP